MKTLRIGTRGAAKRRISPKSKLGKYLFANMQADSKLNTKNSKGKRTITSESEPKQSTVASLRRKQAAHGTKRKAISSVYKKRREREREASKIVARAKRRLRKSA